MGEVGPHRAGEDVWKEQKREDICHANKQKKREDTKDNETQGFGETKNGE